MFVLVVRGQDDNVRSRTRDLDQSRSLDTIHSRHYQVHQHNIRDMLFSELDRFGARICLGHDLEIGKRT